METGGGAYVVGQGPCTVWPLGRIHSIGGRVGGNGGMSVGQEPWIVCPLGKKHSSMGSEVPVGTGRMDMVGQEPGIV